MTPTQCSTGSPLRQTKAPDGHVAHLRLGLDRGRAAPADSDFVQSEASSRSVRVFTGVRGGLSTKRQPAGRGCRYTSPDRADGRGFPPPAGADHEAGPGWTEAPKTKTTTTEEVTEWPKGRDARHFPEAAAAHARDRGERPRSARRTWASGSAGRGARCRRGAAPRGRARRRAASRAATTSRSSAPTGRASTGRSPPPRRWAPSRCRSTRTRRRRRWSTSSRTPRSSSRSSRTRSRPTSSSRSCRSARS